MLTTVPGIEEVVIRELKMRLNVENIKFEKVGITELGGRVIVELPESVKDIKWILEMRSIEKAFLVYDEGTVGPRREDIENLIRKLDISWIENYITPYTTFAVRSVRAGKHEYTSLDICRLLGQKIVDEVQRRLKFRPTVNLDDPDIVVELDVIGDKYILSLELLRWSLRSRKYRVFYHEAAINPPLAFAMNVLLDYDPEGEYLLLDPLCGSGTIIIEGLHYYRRAMYLGVDIDRRNCRGALMNCTAANVQHRVTLIAGDSTRLSNFVREVDGIVTNPPFGIRLEALEELQKFYIKILREFEKVLREGGRAVIITPRVRLMEKALEKTKMLNVVRRVQVEQGGMLSIMFILEKKR